MFKPGTLTRACGVALPLLALAACAQPSQMAAKPEIAPSTSGTYTLQQLRWAEHVSYQRGFDDGRRYQAKLDATRPPSAAPISPSPAPATTLVPPQTPVPAPSGAPPVQSYAPSGPAQPVAIPAP